MKQKKLVTFAIAAISLLLGLLCLWLLPERVAVQWSTSGQVANQVSKSVAVLIGWGITALLLCNAWGREKRYYLWLALLGPVFQLGVLLANR